jgi:mycothiol maleylpyruvate isomerase-like protein
MASTELSALFAILTRAASEAPTACTAWTAHAVVAHLATGAKERADLIEDKLAGRSERATKAFAEREAAFLRLRDEELRAALVRETTRFEAAVTALAQHGAHATVAFAGTRFTAAQLATHHRSEAAIHRWDLVGPDETGDALLAQRELTQHGVAVLNSLQTLLHESPTQRVQHARVSAIRIVLRSPDHQDIVLKAAAGEGVSEISNHVPLEGDALVTTDAAQRLLILWGRRPTARPIDVDAQIVSRHAVEAVLWPAARLWPGNTSPRMARAR